MDRPFFFVHVPKTAGTSFRSLLRDATPGRRFVEMPLREEGRRRAAEHLGATDLVVGHVGYGLAGRFPVPPITFTLLREPIERALSNFSFLQNHPPSAPGLSEDEADFAAAAGRTLEDFLHNCPQAASRHLGNLHVWFLTRDGLAPRADLRELDQDDLERAKGNLRAMDAFGLVERMPESLLLILSTLRLPVSLLEGMPLENCQERRLRASDLDEATMMALRQACALDLELHEFARTLFEERLDSLTQWAASWLPPFWLSAPRSTVMAERALAASREEVLARLLAERVEKDEELQLSTDLAEEALAALAAAEQDCRESTASLAKAELARAEANRLLEEREGALRLAVVAREAAEEERDDTRARLAEIEADRLRALAALSGASSVVAAVRGSLSWRTIESLRGLFGKRWNI